MATREALRLLDAEPVLDAELLALGRWIAAYYCAPLGEVLRAMLPLAAEIRRGKVYSLTDAGRDAARQLLLDAAPDDPVAQVLRMLEERPLSAAYLAKKLPLADKAIRSLERKGFIVAEQVQTERDPLRAPADRLRVELAASARRRRSCTKAERELLAFLELHPGLAQSEGARGHGEERQPGGAVAGAQGRGRPEARAAGDRPPVRCARRTRSIRRSRRRSSRSARPSSAAQFHTFLLHGVTGSGKTEVYLNAIEAALAAGRSALLLVPEIALTPADGRPVLRALRRPRGHPALARSPTSERAEQWRRIRSGAARVVVGTRSGVFAPVRNLGLIVVDEEHDGSYKQEETPRYNGRDVAIVRAQAAGACVVLGSATPSLESRYNAERGKYTLLELPGPHRGAAHAAGRADRHARRSFWRRASRPPSRAA